MPRGKKKVGEYIRKVCTCQVFDCHSGEYMDATGKCHKGVELSPEAYESHQQAEQRQTAQNISSSSLWPPSFQKTDISGSSKPDENLVSVLQKLNLTSGMPTAPAIQNKVLSPIPAENLSSLAGSSGQLFKHANTSKDRDITGNAQNCSIATAARAAGVQVYNSGMYTCLNHEHQKNWKD